MQHKTVEAGVAPAVAPPSALTTVFFFSSRRRHTRSLRDWSSDVCSSDLAATGVARLAGDVGDRVDFDAIAGREDDRLAHDARGGDVAQHLAQLVLVEIGRASCRERVEVSVVAGACNTKPSKRV